MAKSTNSLELLLSCQVCFEEFTEDGAHAPRILPCSHTLCHTCIGQLIKDWIECPECRQKHKTTNKERSFPQNKYIVTLMKRKMCNEQLTLSEFQTCEEHGKELNMFCKESQCNKPICRTCLRTQHRRHDVTEIEEMQKEILMEKIASVEMNLEANLKIISEASKNIADKTKLAIENLKKKKKEMVKHFDKMIKETEEQSKLENMRIDNEVSSMNSNLDLIKSIRRNTENLTFQEIMNNLETVDGIMENNKANFCGVKSLGFHVFTIDLEEENLGSVVKQEMIITLPEPEKRHPVKKLPETIRNTSQLKCSGI